MKGMEYPLEKMTEPKHFDDHGSGRWIYKWTHQWKIWKTSPLPQLQKQPQQIVIDAIFRNEKDLVILSVQILSFNTLNLISTLFVNIQKKDEREPE